MTRFFEDVRFNYDTVFRRLQELAYLNRGLKIVFLDERVSDPARRETTFHYEGGIIDYVRYLNDGKNRPARSSRFTSKGRRIPSSAASPFSTPMATPRAFFLCQQHPHG